MPLYIAWHALLQKVNAIVAGLGMASKSCAFSFYQMDLRLSSSTLAEQLQRSSHTLHQGICTPNLLPPPPAFTLEMPDHPSQRPSILPKRLLRNAVSWGRQVASHLQAVAQPAQWQTCLTALADMTTARARFTSLQFGCLKTSQA